ncbi:D-sorbitol dehydrogenase [Diaphorobacter sp. HDW4A]|uniref:sugar dehydrogenase complex small subunit n=1 Tax=Diaphorobacter sp. HDW4A TaxID=2714924 RepID=UPI00140B97C2|nr:sugar dehydrogenase complex small subunit [Diaphorobacter sp. HDW4A]QIL83503.1 D-sorbitol dehydrogenase [Diaphorobacter sp. HDW4A]
MQPTSRQEQKKSRISALAHIGPSLQRRQVLLSVTGISALLAARQWLPTAIAQTPGSKEPTPAPSAEVISFLNFSRKLTGHSELSHVTARRILNAGNSLSASFAPHVAELVKLTNDAQDARALIAAAELAGLKHHALEINAVWYTGTVVGPKQSQVVAYREALMYSTVQDALPVPTYCLNGPLWWTQKPPAV